MRTNNPMKDPSIAARARRSREMVRSPSKIELRFRNFAKVHSLPISFRGNGRLWINRKNPDFRVLKQKKVIEITSNGIFNGGSIQRRNPANYGIPMAAHYRRSGWACLVIFCPADHRKRIPTKLSTILEDFASPNSQWSGVWHFDRLIRFDLSRDRSASTTSPALRCDLISPTA
jgi:hypothetical protein